jgi:non-homologous end joining protein Ku
VDSETGEVVPREDTARGYEIGNGQYLLVEDKEFEAIQIESTRDVKQFTVEAAARCINQITARVFLCFNRMNFA